MFLEHFGLNEQPFGVTPDPRFLYLSSTHRDALSALDYGTEADRGFLALVGKPGMGKTSLLFKYLDGMQTKARTVFLFQTDCNSHDLMKYLLADLEIDGAGKDLPEMHAILNQVLMEEARAGRRFILVIDEAQNLDEKALEAIRLLSNCETPKAKLMQIILAGQPQLVNRLALPSMSQLRQRISFTIRVEPFSNEQVEAYIDHRLSVAGYKGPALFTKSALALIAQHSEGIPRNINNICFNSLSLAWAVKQRTVDRNIVHDILGDLDLGSVGQATPSVPSSPAMEPEYRINKPLITFETEAPLRGWLPRLAVSMAFLFALAFFFVYLASAEKQGASPQRNLPVEPTFPDRASPGLGNSAASLSPEIPSSKQVEEVRSYDDISVSRPADGQSPTRMEIRSEVPRSPSAVPGPSLHRNVMEKFDQYGERILAGIRSLFHPRSAANL